MDQQVTDSARIPSAERSWALFLDVDGTLLHVAETPGAVSTSDALRQLLSDLRSELDGALALVSGRTIEDLDRLFAPLVLPAAGLHGLEHRAADGLRTTLGETAALDHLRPALADFAQRNPSLLLEDKGRALALHYRRAPELRGEAQAEVERLTAKEPDLRVIHGKMVLEIKPRHADKGSAITTFLAEPPFHDRCPVFLGDDVTDEDGFRAVNELGGISIHVGGTADSAARYRLGGVDEAHVWLAEAAAQLQSLAEVHRT